MMTDDIANHGPCRRTAAHHHVHGRDKPVLVSVGSPNPVGRYRLAVVATDATELVRSAGGYLFDHSFAGWDVDVTLLDERQNITPLRVLGVRANEPASEAFRLDPPVRILLIDPVVVEIKDIDWAARRCDADILLTDGPPPIGGATRQTHRLSSAARVFKTHALIAAGSPSTMAESVETFWRVASQRHR
jgi:hypothetical protein